MWVAKLLAILAAINVGVATEKISAGVVVCFSLLSLLLMGEEIIKELKKNNPDIDPDAKTRD